MHKSKRYVLINAFSVGDYLGIFVITLIVAVLLFPKGKLEDLLPLSTDVNIDLSLAYYQGLLKVNPSDQIYLALIQSYIRLGKVKKPSDLFEEFQRKYPENPEAFEYAKLFYNELSPEGRSKLIKTLIDTQLTEKNYLQFRESILKNFPLSYQERVYLEKEIMKRALWAKDYDILKSLILENLYLSRSLEYKIFLLELALATGDPRFARDVAKSIHLGDKQ